MYNNLYFGLRVGRQPGNSRVTLGPPKRRAGDFDSGRSVSSSSKTGESDGEGGFKDSDESDEDSDEDGKGRRYGEDE